MGVTVTRHAYVISGREFFIMTERDDGSGRWAISRDTSREQWKLWYDDGPPLAMIDKYTAANFTEQEARAWVEYGERPDGIAVGYCPACFQHTHRGGLR